MISISNLLNITKPYTTNTLSQKHLMTSGNIPFGNAILMMYNISVSIS